MRVIFTESTLKYIIQEQILSEAKMTIDNFDRVANLMDIKSPDDFYFVQITKRWKDNKDKTGANDERTQGKLAGNYHGGAWYLKSWRVHSPEELMKLKPEIIKICDENNARAYITVNTRSEKETDSFVKIYQSKYPTNDPRNKFASEIVPGQAKSGDNWRNVRPRLILDIDTNDKKVWNEVFRMLEYYGIDILDKYETASGGLHVILPDKNHKGLWAFKREAQKFDKFKDLGRNALVHANEDAKLILYSNVDTRGY